MRRHRAVVLMAMMAGWLVGATAMAQTLANPVINEFEIAPAGSLEWDVLERLYGMHRYDSRDLFRLSRMTVLESIAMYENLRADLSGTLAGMGREGEMSYLWDSAELFYVSVTPSDPISLVRSRPLLGDVETAYTQMMATLGRMPGQSPRAALHLQNIGRMLPVMNALIDAMEADQGIPAVMPDVPVGPSIIEVLRMQTRGLVDDLGRLKTGLRQEKRSAVAAREALIAEIDGLIALAQGFDRLLNLGASEADILDAFRRLRDQCWPVEARFLRVAGTGDRWRPIRARMREISDLLGRPRIIAVEEPEVPRPVGKVDRRLLAGTDKAVVALDEDLASLASKEIGLQFREEFEQLRGRLLTFREQVAAGEPAAVLSRTLRDAESRSRRLDARARSEARIFRGGERLDPRPFHAADQTVRSLRALLPAAPAGSKPPDGRSPAGTPDRR